MRETWNGRLSNAEIAERTQTVEALLTESGMNRENTIHISFALEEALLSFQKHIGAEGACRMTVDRRFGRFTVRLFIRGDAYNPFAENGEEDLLMHTLLSNAGMTPQWSYRNGENVLSYSAKKEKKNGTIRSLVLAIGLGILVALLVKLLPQGFQDGLVNELMTPIYNTFVGLISFMAGPLIFLSVLWGIYSIGDTATLSRVGKRMLARFLIMLFLLSLITFSIQIPFYPIRFGRSGEFQFSSLFQMILDIIPDNLISPFLTGNSLQIIFIAAVTGIAMLILAEKTTVAAKFIEQMNYIVQLTMEAVSKLVPLFIFLSIFNLVFSGDLQLMLGSYKMFLLFLASNFVLLAIYLTLVCIRKKVRPQVIIPKMMPAFLIGLTTSSSSAAFAANLDICDKELGIDTHIANIGVPLGQAIFKVGAAILFYSVGIYVAEYYGADMTLSWYIMLYFLTVILAIAAPPIPGGGLTVYALLVLQMGLPDEAVAFCCALGVIPEFVTVAANISSLEMELVELAGSLGMLNWEILHRKKTDSEKMEYAATKQ